MNAMEVSGLSKSIGDFRLQNAGSLGEFFAD